MGLWANTLIRLIKSRTLVYAFALSALGVFLITTGGKVTDLTIPIRLVVACYFLALATYLYNDITDYKTDTVNKRNSIYNLENRRQQITKYYTITFFVVSTMLAFSINIPTGIASVAFSILALLYSHPKTHLKNMFVIKTAVTGGGAFIISMMGCLSSGSFSSLGVVSSLIGFSFYFILGPLGDIGDLKGDKEDGRRTFPIVIGIKNSFMLMIVATFAISSIFLISNVLFGINIIGVGLGITVTLFMLIRIIQASRKYTNKLELGRYRNSIRYCMFACQISMLVGTALVGMT
ncbi:MAG: UbiA family prenyltransferase [Thaumarchaeota archaeon]|nr:UbiA family prenyltransferase [Nitrososphaerota archaeon]